MNLQFLGKKTDAFSSKPQGRWNSTHCQRHNPGGRRECDHGGVLWERVEAWIAAIQAAKPPPPGHEPGSLGRGPSNNQLDYSGPEWRANSIPIQSDPNVSWCSKTTPSPRIRHLPGGLGTSSPQKCVAFACLAHFGEGLLVLLLEAFRRG